ncbi:carboxypeptidase regulatory-like domain-containing protein [Terriglobus sp. RCC_193]|uniref:carboxypeptidase regulatory-like domain-containing protein n=1 Tax=Terriglobus sp. RCC_193 TaxID=3239218 RepID=UPI0035264CA2
MRHLLAYAPLPALFLSATMLHAQNSTGAISITVFDAGGAAVPNAQVVVIGTDTGVQLRSLTTNDHGIAEVPLVPPGNYNVSITASGFRTYQQQSINVQVGATVTLRPALELGSASDAVTVTSQAPLIEDKSQTIQQVIENKELTDIPLNGRNYIQAANFIPGVVPQNAGRDNSFVAYGNDGLQNSFLLDGARNVNYLRGLDNGQRDMVRPPLDALQEFTVQTSNYSAEFGAGAGAILNAITRSGTNKWHGSAYDFIRNKVLDAKPYFSSSTAAKQQLVQNQYGGSLGGHILKDKLFFFGAYEGRHTKSSSFNQGAVPTALERSGDFSQSKYTVYDPATTAGSGSTATRTAFSGNKIPSGRINTLGQQLANLYPLPNAVSPTDPYTHYYTSFIPSKTDVKNGIGRVDYTISSKDSIFARYGETLSNAYTGVGLPGAQDPGNSRVDSKGIGAGYTRIITQSLLNELRFSWTSIADDGLGTFARNEYIPGLLDPNLSEGWPTFAVTSFGTLGSEAVGNTPLHKTSGVWDWADNVSWSHGKHLSKFGGEMMWIRPNTQSASNGRGSLGFTGAFTQLPSSRSNSGNAVGDLLLGYANSVTTGTILSSEERGWYYGGYANDQWNITPNLTINYGARYEIFTPFYDVDNREANFITDPDSPLYLQYIKAGIDTRLPRALVYTDKNNIAPRVGFAYRVPNVKDMTIRGSFGMFYSQDQGLGITSRLSTNPPYNNYGAISQSSDQINTSTSFQLSANQSVPRPAPVDPATFTLAPTYTGGVTSWVEHMQYGYVEQWSLSAQKQMPWGILTELNYVGNHGVHLLGRSNVNQPKVLNGTTVQSRRPLFSVTQGAVNQIGDWNASQYQGLSARVEKRFSKGIQFRNSITYGRTFSLLSQALDVSDSATNGDTLQNPYDHAANWGPADFDIPFRYVLNGIFSAPTGSHAVFNNRIASAVLGGWAVSPVYVWQMGQPLTPATSTDLANSGATNRPNQLCPSGQGAPHTISRWFNTSCFAAQTQYTYGNASKGSIRGPGQNRLDLSLQRNFGVPRWEAANLNFRIEGFNVLNHVQYGNPNVTVGNTAFGTISSAQTMRQVQVAARLTF